MYFEFVQTHISFLPMRETHWVIDNWIRIEHPNFITFPKFSERYRALFKISSCQSQFITKVWNSKLHCFYSAERNFVSLKRKSSKLKLKPRENKAFTNNSVKPNLFWCGLSSCFLPIIFHSLFTSELLLKLLHHYCP